MARTRPANARRQHPQSGTQMDTTRKKEVRTAKDDVATNSDGRAERDRAVVGRGSGLSQGQHLVAEDCCGLMSHWGRRGLSK